MSRLPLKLPHAALAVACALAPLAASAQTPGMSATPPAVAAPTAPAVPKPAHPPAPPGLKNAEAAARDADIAHQAQGLAARDQRAASADKAKGNYLGWAEQEKRVAADRAREARYKHAAEHNARTAEKKGL
jgi:hypothetical protein